MKSALEFMAALRKYPLFVQAWLMTLGIFNMMLPIILIGHMEAQMMLAATMISFAIGIMMFKKQGMGCNELEGLFGFWIATATIITTLCLLIDLKDVAQYLRGVRG